MTVSTEISSNEYTGNGVTTDFDYKFRIFKANQLSVITSDADGGNVVTLRLGTDYTVTGANKSTGGKVILTKPLANGHKISIARDIPIKQETSFRNQSKFLAETHEDAFDYLTMILQRIWGSLGSLYLKRPNILANWFDAKGYRIANLAKPKRDSDAVDLGTMKDEIEGVNSTILKREKRLLRVDDMDITSLPKASERAGNVLTFDSSGMPQIVAPASGSAIDVINKLGKIVKTYSTFFEMKNDNDVPTGAVVKTLGFYSPLDSGGACYHYESTGSGDGFTSFKYEDGFINLIPTSSINAAALGIRYGEGAANILAIKAAIKYLQNGVDIERERVYTKSELQQLHNTATKKTGNKPKELQVTGIIDHSEPLHIIGGFSIITPNNKGAYPNTMEDAGFFYSGTDFDIGITTGIFVKVDGGFKLVTTIDDVKYLHSVAKNYFGNVEVITDKITWATSFGAKNGTPIGAVIGASSSKFDGCNFGMTNALANLAFVGFECWDTNFDACCFHSRYQAAAWLSCNSSCVQREPYYTSIEQSVIEGIYTIHPASSEKHDFTKELIAVYYGYASCTAYAPKHETNGLSHMVVADLASNVTYHGQYYETHNPEYNIKTCLSMFNDSIINAYGGFIPASYYDGVNIYRENIGRGRQCSINTAFTYNGGYLYEDVNCESQCYVDPFHSSGDGAVWGRRALTKNVSSLNNINVYGVNIENVRVISNAKYIDFNVANSIESALILCKKFNCRKIRLLTDVKLTKSIDVADLISMEIESNNYYSLDLSEYRVNSGFGTRLIFNGVTIKSNFGDTNYNYYIIGNNDNCHYRFTNCKFVGRFGIAGGFLLNTYSVMELTNCDLSLFKGGFFFYNDSNAVSTDEPIVYVNKNISDIPESIRNTPFKGINGGVFKHL
ncbi:hypothetical protein [Providencia hangzhouensis]|uniref:hypothetical protein n=1 Tax=Providencia hangzhouensis TaxID=3031799 RepID=UPI003F4A2B5F